MSSTADFCIDTISELAKAIDGPGCDEQGCDGPAPEAVEVVYSSFGDETHYSANEVYWTVRGEDGALRQPLVQ
eukprot:949540-Rhodomonas_salina.1